MKPATSLYLTAIALFLISVAAVALWSGISLRASDTAKERLDNDTNVAASILERNMRRHLDLTANTASAFTLANGSVSQENWEVFVDQLELEERYPAVSSITYFAKVDSNEVDGFYEGLGVEKPVSNVFADENYIVEYIPPRDSSRNRAIGIPSSDNTRPFIEAATEKNEVIITELFYTVTTEQPVFIMFAPVYTDDWEQVEGVIGVTFRLKELSGTLLPQAIEAGEQVNLELASSSDPEVSFVSVIDSEGELLGVNLDGNTLHRSESTAKASNQTFYIALEARADYGLTQDEKNAPYIIAATGLISVLAIAYVSWYLIRVGSNRYRLNLSRFKEAVDNSADSIIFTDPNGKIIYANRAATDISGYANNEIVGATPKLWGGLMSEEFYKNMWNRISKDKKVFYGKLKNKRKSGQIYDVQLQVIPILDLRGRIKFYVGIEQDISKYEELEQQKVDFVTITSHQLRTPLTAIKWNLELIEDSGEVGEKALSHFREIASNNERMIELIDDLLKVSRFERGELEDLEMARFDLAELAREVISEHGDNFEERELICEAEIPEKIEFTGDRGMIKIVLENLISNAIKYSPESSQVEVSLNQEGKKILISVTDKGIGIPEEDQDQVFQKFFRAFNAKQQHVNGSGLGLYISRSIVEGHGGDIRFESEKGKGTTFIVELNAD